MTKLLLLLEIARQNLLLLARHRLVVAALLATAVPCLLLLCIPAKVARQKTGEDLFCVIGYFSVLQLGMPFLALCFGVLAVHGDIEDRTSTYVFLRPIRRAVLLLGKWLAAAVLSFVLVAFVLLAMYAAAALPRRPWRAGIGPSAGSAMSLVLCSLLGAPAYAAIGAFAGAYFKRPLLLAMGFLIGWEVIVSNLPPESGVRVLTIADPLRRWLLDHIYSSPQLVEALTFELGREAVQTGNEAVNILRATAIVLVLAMAVYSRREYDSRPRD